MIELAKKSDCCGCGGCVAICPRKAISMKTDDEGFEFPVINKSLCTNCDMCEKVCDFGNRISSNNEHANVSEFKQEYYAAYNTDSAVVKESSSGGIFTLLADYVLGMDGSVYGVYLDESFCVKYGSCNNRSEVTLAMLRGSKYVQAYGYEVYDDVTSRLKNGECVLFTGTPCQIHSLKAFLRLKNVSTDNLYLVDFICHGVSSKRVWHDYINYLEKQYGRVTSYTFRGKKKGWHGWYPIVKAGDKDISDIVNKHESFIKMYQTMHFNRRSCFKCPYTSYERTSDITLADFWNVDSFAKDMDNNRGTSELLINTAKGKALLEAIKDGVVLKQCSKEDAWQPHLEYPNHLPKSRRDFWEIYEDEGIDAAIKKYGSGDVLTKAKNMVTPVLKKTGLYTAAGKAYKKVFVKKSR